MLIVAQYMTANIRLFKDSIIAVEHIPTQIIIGIDDFVSNQRLLEVYEDKRFRILIDDFEQNVCLNDPLACTVEYKINQLTLKDNSVDYVKEKNTNISLIRHEKQIKEILNNLGKLNQEDFLAMVNRFKYVCFIYCKNFDYE